jgi:hypothetical protein
MLVPTKPESAGDKQAKKARSLPTGPWKFWERMPERQVLYDPNRVLLQVRNDNYAVARFALDVAFMFIVLI